MHFVDLVYPVVQFFERELRDQAVASDDAVSLRGEVASKLSSLVIASHISKLYVAFPLLEIHRTKLVILG